MIQQTEKEIQENEANGDKQAAGQTDCVPEKDEDEISDVDGEECEQTQSNGQHKVENESVKEERDLEEIGQHNYSKSLVKKGSGFEREEEVAVKMEDSALFDSNVNFSESTVKRNETEETDILAQQKKEEVKEQCLAHDRKARRQRIKSKHKVKLFISKFVVRHLYFELSEKCKHGRSVAQIRLFCLFNNCDQHYLATLTQPIVLSVGEGLFV